MAATERFIDSHDFHRARQELASLAERFGSDSRINEMAERLEKTAQSALANNIILVSQHVENLMKQGDWDHAERIVLELADKYPTAVEPTALVERVQRERKAFALKHRQRMHDEIQQFVNQRRWQEALVANRKFIETFPAGVDTDALRAQTPTLQANAEIQARQKFEHHIKQYIEQHQYWDALAMARRIITEYPLSPQANALRSQLPRLEELARSQPGPKP